MGANASVSAPDMSSFEFLICFLSPRTERIFVYICIFLVCRRLAKLAWDRRSDRVFFSSFFDRILAYRCFALIETISAIVALINLWPLLPIRNSFWAQISPLSVASANKIRKT